MSRIAPIGKPYSAEHPKLFDLVMSEGMEPPEFFQLCGDDLHDESTASNETWSWLAEDSDEMQILELIYTAGIYHTVSFLVNGLRIKNE